MIVISNLGYFVVHVDGTIDLGSLGCGSIFSNGSDVFWFVSISGREISKLEGVKGLIGENKLLLPHFPNSTYNYKNQFK